MLVKLLKYLRNYCGEDCHDYSAHFTIEDFSDWEEIDGGNELYQLQHAINELNRRQKDGWFYTIIQALPVTNKQPAKVIIKEWLEAQAKEEQLRQKKLSEADKKRKEANERRKLERFEKLKTELQCKGLKV